MEQHKGKKIMDTVIAKQTGYGNIHARGKEVKKVAIRDVEKGRTIINLGERWVLQDEKGGDRTAVSETRQGITSMFLGETLVELEDSIFAPSLESIQTKEMIEKGELWVNTEADKKGIPKGQLILPNQLYGQ